MDPNTTILILTLISKAARLLAMRNNIPFKDAVDELFEAVKGDLPANADGTPFTNEQVQQAAAEARAAWGDV